MIDNEIRFYKQEKLRFTELLNKLGWTDDCLLNEQKTFIQCPIDRGHRFPYGSKHVENCQLVKEGFSKEYLKELSECEQEKQLLNQSGILLTPYTLSNILHRPVTSITNIPFSVEQTTILFTPNERSLIAQTIHNEALRLKIVPSTPLSFTDSLSMQSHDSNVSQQLNKLAELRDQKRRRAKYVTQTRKKSFYDVARDMINTEMELITQMNCQIDTDPTPHDEHKKRHSKHKHRSKSKKKTNRKHKKRDRSSRSDSRKHHRHLKKRRRSK